MKKNKIMRLASILLVAVVLSTCAISGTFAKYTTYGESADEARVAKWGVTVTATDADALFANAYGTSVTGESSADVVAPGTNGTFGGFTISGTPEVAVEIEYAATVTFGGTWTNADGNYYCPIVVSVGGTAVDTTDVDSVADYKAAIEAAIAAVSTSTINPGTAISSSLSITWSWDFGDGSTDAADTYLGNLTGDSVPTIAISVTATVNQVN